MRLPTVRVPPLAVSYGTTIPTPPTTQPTGMGPPDPVQAANPPGDPAASQNVVTMCPQGYVMSSMGCMGPDGNAVVPGAVAVAPTFVQMPSTFPWLAIGLGVLGAVAGGLAGRHYKRPAIGASIGGLVGLIGGNYASHNLSFSFGG